MALLLLAACSLTGDDDKAQPPSSTETPAVDSVSLVVVWASGGDLIVWRHDDPAPRRIAEGEVIRPFLAPDGTWIASLRGPEGDAQSLWITDTAGTTDRQLLDPSTLADGGDLRRPSQVVWAADSRALYFNTIVGAGMDIRPADDLWRAEIESGTVERLLPDGDGGKMVLSPDGTVLALAAAGEYTQPGEPPRTPGTIAFYTPVTSARTLVLEFPAVATASSQRWHANPSWKPDGSGVYVAIPPAELVYSGEELATALWWLPVRDAPQQMGDVLADFFGLPVFSPDGEWIAYTAPLSSQEEVEDTLMIARGDGTEPVAYQTDLGTFFDQWLPEGDRFLYSAGALGHLFIGERGGEPVPFPGPDVGPYTVLVNEVLWVRPDAYVSSASVYGEEGYTLSYGSPGTSPQSIATISIYSPFDAVAP